MLTSAFKAFGDLLSVEFRSVVLKALGMTVILFVSTLVAVEVLIVSLTQFSWPWADWILAIGTGAVLLVAFFFLVSPVTAAFAGLFLDGIAQLVEAKHYPRDPPGVPLPVAKAVVMALQFFVVVLLVNLAILPVVFFGIGAIALIAVNGYLLGREYFQMVAMRHMSIEEAHSMRRENAPSIFIAGLLPAILSLIPIVNFVVPLFATAYFTHYFKSVQAFST